MANQPADKFEYLEELYSTDAFATFRVRRAGDEFRLTRIAREFSDSTAFRAAFRKDQSVLAGFHHDNVLQFIDWGEIDGRFFYLTPLPDGIRLSERLELDESFSFDEVIDIGWQIASGLQSAHNCGITHGQLTTDSILLSEPLRIKIAGFGLYQWLHAAEDEGRDVWANLSRDDLHGLGTILQTLFAKAVVPESSRESGSLRSELRKLISELNERDTELTARDVQGRLGNMLLQVAGDSIEMLDNREGQGLSRRSIVDELFDEPESLPTESSRQERSGCFGLFLVTVCALGIVVRLCAKAALFND